MSRRKNILMASACIVLGMALAGPAAHAAEEILTAVRSTHQFYLDGEQIQLEAYLINGNNYVKLADVGEALDFNVYWDDAVRIESGTPYTGHASEQASGLEQTRQDIAALVNQVRREHGLPELAVDQRLMTAAQELSGKKYTWHHNRRSARQWRSRIPLWIPLQHHCIHRRRLPDISQQAVENWVNSPGHLQAMLAPDADSLGVGVTVEQGVTYCYLLLGDPTTNNPYG